MPGRSLLLLIEDRRVDAQIARVMLERVESIRVDQAHSRASAMEWLERNRADYLVADLGLPDTKDMTDREWVEELLELSRGAKVYVLSGEPDPQALAGLSISVHDKSNVPQLVAEIERYEAWRQGSRQMLPAEESTELAVARALERLGPSIVADGLDRYFVPRFRAARMMAGDEPDWVAVLDAARANARRVAFWGRMGDRAAQWGLVVFLGAILAAVVLGAKVWLLEHATKGRQ